MILAFCVDDQGGLAFNHRRQSRDRALVANLLAAAGARPVFCLPYSAGLFDPGTVTVVDAPGAVPADGILFLENTDPAAYIPHAEELLLYRWNRLYPADLTLNGTPVQWGYRLQDATDFAGTSHEKITRERYVKKKGHNMAKGKKKTTLWVVLAAVILAIFALGKLGGSEPGTTARQTTAAVTETTVQTTAGTTAKQTAGSAKAKTAAKKKQTAANVPAFSGKPYVVLDDNQPDFSAKDKKRRSAYESYAPLDSLGRCGVAFACLCKETMPTEKRGEIGQVRPSGWHTVKYDTVDGKYLYNRCHLIGYQLSAENANTRNLITGTRYLNTQGMLPFENLVADYIKETGNHVLYRVTPIFSGDDLVAKGVEMEAWSVEDRGDGVCFHVYCYNNQPGIKIDYATGDSHTTDGRTGTTHCQKSN